MTTAWEKKGAELLIGILHTGQVTSERELSFRQFNVPLNFLISYNRGQPYDGSRNYLAQVALDRGCDWLFFLDSDSLMPIDGLQRLLAHNQPLISALYYRRHPPYNPAMWKRLAEPREEGMYSGVADWPRGKLIEVDAVGMGACLIHRRVLEKIQELPAEHFLFLVVECKDCKGYVKYLRERDKPTKCPHCGGTNLKHWTKPWFEWTMNRVPMGTSEDFNFAEKAKACGFSVLVDTSVIVEHDVSGKVGSEGKILPHSV